MESKDPKPKEKDEAVVEVYKMKDAPIEEKPKRKRRTQKQRSSSVTKDNPGHIRNRPVSHLPETDYLKLRVNSLEAEKLSLQISKITTEIDRNDKVNQILRRQVSELKVKLEGLTREHGTLVADINKRLGIDIRNKTIDTITRELIDVVDA
jgi:hypothetical protein